MSLKKHFSKILFFVTLITLIIFSNENLIYADSQTTPDVYSPSCILIEASSGKILYSKNANEKMYPASTTKVMTAILTLENCNLTDIVTISHDAIYNVPYGYSIASLYEGEQLTVDQLLHVLLIPSANDAAFALAEHIGGSVENFANMMNEKAIQIGCKNTHFVNPNGIHNENHYSTAYDLALIGQYAMKNDIFKTIVSTTSYTLPITNKYNKSDRLFNTTNDLIKPASKYYYQYATGAKTGFTEFAKNCIIATATKNNIQLICVILHDEKTDTGLCQRETDCKTLFEYGFNNYSFQTIATKDSVQKTLNIMNASKDTKSLDLITADTLTALNPIDYNSDELITNIILNENIKAPINKGDKLGTITFTSDNYNYTTDLIASHDVYAFDFVKTSLEILLIIILLIIISIFTNIRKKKNKNKIFSQKTNKHKRKRSNLHFK